MLARAAVIIVLGLIAYASMLPSPFRLMDDRISIVDNQAIKSTQNIPEIFREGYFHDQSYYRPLINLSFMVEYHFFGLHSFFYNLDNLILHIVNALLVGLLVTRLTGNNTMGFWVGLLFVLHPVQWEAVCNVPGRAILMSAFFVLSSFILFFEFYQRGRWWALPLVLVTFFLALLCKESAGVLPMVVLAYLALDKTRSWPGKLISLWPFFVDIAAYILLRKYLGITDIHHPGQPMALVLGFVTFLRSVITDLRLFILPVDLHYDRSLPFMMSLMQPAAIGTCFFWSVVLIIVVRCYRIIHPFILFLMGWFALELLPVSQLVSSIGVGQGRISTAEHFLYLACIPVFIATVGAFQWCYALNLKRGFVKPAILKFLAGGFLVFLLLTSIEQSIYASNEFSLVSRSLNYDPNNPRLQSEMGMLSVFRNDIPDAEKHFRLAVANEPLNPTYHIALGAALGQQGKSIEALEQFVVFDPGKDKALVDRQEKLTMSYINRQLAQGKNFDSRGWLAIGIYYVKMGQNPPAIDAFGKSARLNPGLTDAWFDLGSLYEADHDWHRAKLAYEKLLSLPNATGFQRDFASKHLNYVEIHQR